jgi:vacuolar-type H+-ATPase subunit F/Vma7
MSIGKTTFAKKIAIVADKRTITVFRLAGLEDVYPVDSYEDAEKCINQVLKNPNFFIVLVTERIVNKLQDVLEKMYENKYPLIIPIPSVEGQIKVKTDLISMLIKQKAGIEFKLNDM